LDGQKILHGIIEWAHHLDWGNVPSWASAGSLIVAVGVFARDRRRHQRRQVDEVAVWGSLEKLDFNPRIDDIDPLYCEINFGAKNASKLPVHNVQVNFTVVTWKRTSLTLARDYLPKYARHCRIVGTLNPDEVRQLPKMIVDENKDEDRPALFGSEVQMRNVHVRLSDSSGKSWVFRPFSGKAARPVGIGTALRYLGSDIRRKKYFC